MATTPLPPDFSAFLRLLNEYEVKYLLIGGYAVGYHGYVRATADMDVWVERERKNAERLASALADFGFDIPEVRPDLFLEEGRIVRMGVPPVRIEIQTSISGVEFGPCYAARVVAEWNDVSVNIISLEHLVENKRSAGRLKDLNDLEYLGCL